MSKTKKWLIAAVSLCLIGCIIFVGVMMSLEWDFRKLSTTKHQTAKYEITENYKNILIVSDTADVNIMAESNPVTVVECFENTNEKHIVKVENDTLIIKIEDTKKWYQNIGINFDSSEIKIRLPIGEYGSLSIETSTSDIEVSENLKFEDVKISATTGDIELEKISSKNIEISLSTGDVKGEMIDCAEKIEVNTNTGDVEFANTRCKNFLSKGKTGDISLNGLLATEKIDIERTTGDVEFYNSDAAEICIKTDTGDVEGKLLSDKIFFAESNTGSVDVPKTTSGGKCKITTSTGDVKITVKQKDISES